MTTSTNELLTKHAPCIVINDKTLLSKKIGGYSKGYDIRFSDNVDRIIHGLETSIIKHEDLLNLDRLDSNITASDIDENGNHLVLHYESIFIIK